MEVQDEKAAVSASVDVIDCCPHGDSGCGKRTRTIAVSAEGGAELFNSGAVGKLRSYAEWKRFTVCPT
jgi:hypothetical protein